MVGDKNISSNLRYKTGKSLSYNEKEVYEVRDPKDIFLPALHLSSSFIFAKEDFFFAYPNNYNHYVKYYKNTYQHGGISLEEMIIPVHQLRSTVSKENFKVIFLTLVILNLSKNFINFARGIETLQKSKLMKKHNFSAGPCILPQSVLKQASEAVVNFNGMDLSS